LSPPLPNEWEVEESLDPLAAIAEDKQELILRQVGAIWPVSNSLCYSYLACADNALSCLDEEQVSGWVAAVLDIYEKKGLKAAQTFMADVESNYLCRLRGETGVRLSEVAPRLLPYAKSIFKGLVALQPGEELHTDTETIFLHRKLAIFPAETDNFLVYKLMVTTQLLLIKARTYETVIEGNSPAIMKLKAGSGRQSTSGQLTIEEFWQLFPEPRLAEDLFTLAEGWRISKELADLFPGLWRDTADPRSEMARRRPSPDSLPAKSRAVEILCRYLIANHFEPDRTTADNEFRLIIEEFEKAAAAVPDSAEKAVKIYELLQNLPGPYKPVAPLPYLGRLKPAEAQRVRLRKRTATRDKFIKTLAAILPEPAESSPDDQRDNSRQKASRPKLQTEEATALLINPTARDLAENEPPSLENNREKGQFLTLAGPEIELTEELKEMIAEISADLGQVPTDYISAAHGLAGKGESPRQAGEALEGTSLTGAITYDEWDFRRAGFRKEWCVLNEKKVSPVRGTFVQNTLDKYRGLLIKLKKQFEMLRCTERLLKRQRDGDDIDLDAVIESITDTRAGRPESEKLFVRLRRDERDIAVMFLIDMSASTEGWVGEALKEALILMGESLEVLGDRFAVCGFSGMRRTRSDFYHIKDFDEKYSQEIEERIAAIAPQEYTRMGPPIRHATGILQEVDARVRLLIILSDGKPEDYDDYKGEYAIEDTRHALIEAKAAGIHPFCITIDQQAHDYNAHMYGEVNYIFLDKVRDLPVRMPAIYRNLTT